MSVDRSTRKLYRCCYWAMTCFLGFCAVGTAQPPSSTFPVPGAPRCTGETVAAARDNASPLDEPLRMIAEARTAFQAVRDYTCVLIKQERVNGRLTPEHIIDLRVRNQPLGVYMRFMEPRDLAGQEAAYDAPTHGNKMRVHPVGGLGLVGWVTIDQKDPRAMKTNRHTISEAGIANLIDRYLAGWQTERPLGKTQVNIGEYEYNKRRCTRVETTHPVNTVGQFEYYRTVLYFDKEQKIPIRVECYDYPRGNDGGELLESYSYVNLRFNAGLGDETFRK